MIRFVPKDRIEETHGERMVAAANLRTMRRKEPNKKAAMAQIRKEAPKKQRSSTELERIGASILEGLEYLLERNKENKAKKAAWEEGEGKKAWAASSGETERERNAARMGGKKGQQAGVKASYRASARRARRNSTKVDAFTKAQAERRASHKPMLQRVAGAAAALRNAKKDRPKLP